MCNSNRLSIFIVLVILFYLLSGCGGGGNSPTSTGLDSNTEPPEITSISPDSGAVGTEVTINGINFSETASENTVTFNGTTAPVTEARDTLLRTEVPTGATAGPVEVGVGGETATGPDFKVLTKGILDVLIATSGPDQDIDNYKLRLDADTANSVLAMLNDTLRFEEIEQGMHEVHLDSIAGNCTISGTNPRMMEVIATDTVSTTFDIMCEEITLNNKIVFESSRHSSETSSNFEIYLISPDGTGEIRLTNNGVIDRTPVISPNASQIAFLSDRNDDGISEIYIMDADGKNIIQLTDPAMAGADGDGFPSWSPDGTQIAFVRGFDSGTADQRNDIFTINTDGTGLTNISNNAAGVIDLFPAWSPNETQIAFSRSTGGVDGNFDIYLMNTDGTDVTQVTDGTDNDYVPAWSPDGSQIAFASDREHQNDAEAGNFEIYLKEPSLASTAQLLVDLTADGFYPSWSPDGTQLVFFLGNQVHRIDADGSLSSVVKLTDSRGRNDDPHWSPVE